MQPKSLLKVEDNIQLKIELVQPKIQDKILPYVENGQVPMQQPKYLDFANRLKELMEKEGSPIKTVNQLKDIIGVTYEMARRYTLGTAKPREEKLQTLADSFQIDISYLAHGTSFNNDEQNAVPLFGKAVPVISWSEAKIWPDLDLTKFEEWLPANFKCGKNGYGLTVIGESMLPDFRPYDKIYINPDFKTDDLKTGDLVIVACEQETEATFKKLIVESNGMFLEPLNPKWHEKIIKLRKECKLIGKVIGLYRNI